MQTILVTGESQSGKSSLINEVANKKVATVGGYGLPVTAEPKTYDIELKSKKYCFVDTPGYLDGLLRKNDTEIMNEFHAHILEKTKSNQIDAVILTESLSDGSCQIIRNLNKLLKLFGQSLLKSVIIVATKTDIAKRISINSYNRRMNTLRGLCKSKNISIVEWASSTEENQLDKAIRLSQISKLLSEVSKSFAYQLKEVQRMRIMIQKRAEQLRQEAGPMYKTVSFTVPVQTQEPYQASETIYVQEVRQKWKGSFGHITGSKKSYTVNVPKTIAVTKYRRKTHNETKSKQVIVERPLQPFFLMAQKEIAEKVKQNLLNRL